MEKIYYLDRKTKKRVEEKVYGRRALGFLYQEFFLAKILLALIAKVPFFSKLYGFLQSRASSKKKILPFIQEFFVSPEEFAKDVSLFTSFNDFFIRKLKKEARPIANSDAILPADGRYLFYPDLSQVDGFWVKGKKFSLEKLLQDEEKAKIYEKGSMVLIRLAPVDYHRFHFPFDCIASKPKLINGHLYSVNPIALKKNIEIFTENKRVITELSSDLFGKVQYIEVGATYVGSIHQTFDPVKEQKKGDEKGFFSFGGSSIILLFEPGKVLFDEDLKGSEEIKALFGESMGRGAQGYAE